MVTSSIHNTHKHIWQIKPNPIQTPEHRLRKLCALNYFMVTET